MTLDISTLLFLLLMSCGLVGLIFLFSGRFGGGQLHFRAGIAALMCAAGLGLMLARGSIPDRLSIDLANALMILAFGLTWSAVRAFDGKTSSMAGILAGAILWLAACAIPAFYASFPNRVALLSAIMAAYSLACAIELWKGRDDGLKTRMALAALLALHAGALLARGGYIYFVSRATNIYEIGEIESFLMAEPMLVIIAAAILGLALIRERKEQDLRRTAETDPLTGTLNRRGWFARSAEAIAEATRNAKPVAVLLFDLDRFKSINDRFGHIVGDTTLGAFAAVVRREVRSGDIVGRLGGEEFAVMLVGADGSTAKVIAERIRTDFSLTRIGDSSERATVSVGIATADGADADVNMLLASADRALYRAKGTGRDRVETAWSLAG